MHHLSIPNHIQVYDQPITISITPEIAERVRQFAAAFNTHHYEEQRDAVKGKATRDHEIGKLAEFAVAQFLTDTYGFPYLEPDTQIYAPGEKNWAPDLPYDKLEPVEMQGKSCLFPPVHVKSTNRMWGNDWSWTFQCKNKVGVGGRDHIIDLWKDQNEKGVPDHVAFVVVDEDMSVFGRERAAHIHAVAHLSKLPLRDPVLRKHKGFKLCAYLEDLRGQHASALSRR
jgi:hypothetical protein